MANITVTVRTPDVPAKLTVDTPGSIRGTTVALHHFSDAELEEVGKGFTKALKEEAAAQRKAAEEAAAQAEEEDTAGASE